MKKITFALFALIAGTSFAQNSANAEAATFAEIVEPLTIEKDQDLNFGRIIGGSAGGGTVSISAEDAATRTIDDALNAPGGTIQAAKFTITGSDYNYGIKIEGSDLESGESTAMKYTPDSNLSSSEKGDQTLYVGGDLVVGTNQDAGNYEGTVTVTVTYE
ncbi:DUF4402 domain-containing protein [Gillisia sp. M10.2A]|uniref:DUF4402 domain-containing protein n=1 Tax=Gillisia lutea TaxID=2909668 RepID=A0ABS9EFA8_9FLAO|nr:DUF4402 domain-containing protein [Gillisia lutea]MCF4101537.1 DUF4402 domain-containing protein [Gillisia lutea]